MKKKSSVVLLQLSNFASGLGNSIVMITIPWLILERTDSPAFAGLVAAVSALPAIIVSPIGGWLVDHLGRRAVSISADLLSSLSVAAFPIAAATFGLTNTTILLIAVIGAVFDPAGYTARKTLLADVAKKSDVDLDRLNGIHEGFMGIAWIFGPAIGAGLISTVGSINSFWVAAALFILAAVSILFLRVGDLGRESRELADKSGEVLDSRLRLGLITLWEDKLLRTLSIALLILAAVYLPTEAIVLPTYFEGENNPSGLGLVVSALAGGSALGSFGYGWISKRIQRRTLIRCIMLGSAISVIPMAFLPPLPFLMAAGFFLGLSWGPYNPLVNTLVQQRIPAHLHGRVFGIQTAVFYVAPPLGMVLAGLSVENLGVNSTYAILAGILSITSVLVLLTKSLRSKF
jgi:MFS family permease